MNKSKQTKKISFKKNKKNKLFASGFSLVEMLIYTLIMSMFMVVVVNASIVMLGAYSRARTSKLLNTAAVSTLTKISRDVQKSSSVNTANSILGASLGKLVINQPISGGTEAVEFFVSTSTLYMKRGGVLFGSITPNGVVVESLIFNRINNSGKEAIKTSIRIRAERGSEQKVETFYLTTVLRGSY